MRIHNYIERELVRKSIGTYFRKGKWILHVLFILFYWVINLRSYGGSFKHMTLTKAGLATLLMLPFLLFFYTYCLYLIPYCFKRNRYRRFWIILGILLAVFPAVDLLLRFRASPFLPDLDFSFDRANIFSSLAKVYFDAITSFVGFTSMLYFMEILEGLSTYRETEQHEHQMIATELHLLKTRMNPDFMVRSLDGIVALANGHGDHAPGSVVNFSDVLRYRLYRSKEKLVPLSEELNQLSNLMRLHNVLPGQEDTCSLETEGNIDEAQIVPLSLINIAEPLLATFTTGDNWSLLMYVLLEEKEAQVAIELTTDRNDYVMAETQRIHEDLQRLLYSGLNFTVEKEQNTYSLRTCIPIFRNLTASS